MINNDIFDIRDRIVCITGGLGQLGRQFSREVLKRGARVAILDIAASPPVGFDDQISADSNNFKYICVDITNRDTLEKALVTIDGVQYDLEIPSKNVKIIKPWQINDGETLTLTLDFDVHESIHKTGNDKYIMKPVIKLIQE